MLLGVIVYTKHKVCICRCWMDICWMWLFLYEILLLGIGNAVYIKSWMLKCFVTDSFILLIVYLLMSNGILD
jgi:hypothetical protein